MAGIALFEDHVPTQFRIKELLEGTPHRVIGEAYDMFTSYELLTKMALGEVQPGYTLLDSNLRGPQRPFHLTLPDNKESREIAVEVDTDGIGADGRQIGRIIRTCKIPTTIIGIASFPAASWRGDVNHDLTKENLGIGLLELITRVETTKNSQ